MARKFSILQLGSLGGRFSFTFLTCFPYFCWPLVARRRHDDRGTRLLLRKNGSLSKPSLMQTNSKKLMISTTSNLNTLSASAWVNLFFTHSSAVRPGKVGGFSCWQLHRKGVILKTWNQCGNGCFMLFHIVSNEFQWNLTFPETSAHDLGPRRVHNGPNAQRELASCACQIGGILISSQLTFGLL